MTSTPASLLAHRLREDPSGPLLTYYDDASGERIELSATTFDNWVAKTAGLLQDGLGLEPGGSVRLLLPPHWQTLVFAAAAWAVGGVVSTGDTPTESDNGIAIAVTGPDRLDDALAQHVDDVVALSLLPLGGRFRDPLPAGAIDYAVEVPSYPDQVAVMDPPEPSDPAFLVAGVTQTLSGVVERAAERAAVLGASAGSRLLVSTADAAMAIVDALMVPLIVRGSAVLVRNEDPGRRDARIAEEHVTVEA